MSRPNSNPPALPASRHFDVWLFDLDNTLYPASCQIFQQIEARIIGYIKDFAGLSWDAARAARLAYLRDHGTALRGLMTRHEIDPQEFLDQVHEIDLTPVPPSPSLDAALAALPGRKLVFTNASRGHAERVLDRLGIAGRFEDIFDIVAADYVPKPHPKAYQSLLERHAIDPRRTVLFEDLARNLAPAAALGMTTVWVAQDAGSAGPEAPDDHVHHVTRDLLAWLQAVDGGGR